MSADWQLVESSNVRCVRFQPPSTIDVWFHNGWAYSYNADGQTFYDLTHSGSVGKAVHRLLIPRGFTRKWREG